MGDAGVDWVGFDGLAVDRTGCRHGLVARESFVPFAFVVDMLNRRSSVQL